MVKTKTYEICSGAIIQSYDVYSDKIFTFEEKVPEDEWTMRLDYCIMGRLEAEFSGKKYAYIDAGQMAVNTTKYDMVSSYFPLKLYKGLSILLYKQALPEKYLNIWSDLKLDIDEINEKIDRNAVWLMERVSSKIEGIFEDLYCGIDAEESEFLWIKLTELLYYVNKWIYNEKQEYFYFAGNAVERVKKTVKEALHDRDYSVKKMIEVSGIGSSAFYERFKKIYGTSPARYFRDFRLGEAATKLLSTDLSVWSIATETGYANFSKFSSAFKKLYGISPSEYRRRRSR